MSQLKLKTRLLGNKVLPQKSKERHDKPKKKKHRFSGRVGETADMMRQFYKAKAKLPAEEQEEIKIESFIEAADTRNSNEFAKLPSNTHDKVD